MAIPVDITMVALQKEVLKDKREFGAWITTIKCYLPLINMVMLAMCPLQK